MHWIYESVKLLTNVFETYKDAFPQVPKKEMFSPGFSTLLSHLVWTAFFSTGPSEMALAMPVDWFPFLTSGLLLKHNLMVQQLESPCSSTYLKKATTQPSGPAASFSLAQPDVRFPQPLNNLRRRQRPSSSTTGSPITMRSIGIFPCMHNWFPGWKQCPSLSCLTWAWRAQITL